MNVTEDQIKEEFKNQVFLCKGIGKREMLAIVKGQFPKASESNERRFDVNLKESQWDIIADALNAEQVKSQAQIKKARNFPSETIRSAETIDKHKKIISDIQLIQENITEGYL